MRNMPVFQTVSLYMATREIVVAIGRRDTLDKVKRLTHFLLDRVSSVDDFIPFTVKGITI